MNPTILAIDGGGVRGVIPLEFLVLVQESLGRCPLQDLVDLGVGTSSGGLSILGLLTMGWDVRRCAEVFDHVAHQIFRERRTSRLSRLSHALFGSGSVLGTVHKWLVWLLHDSCYDGQVFDKAIKCVYGKERRIFDGLRSEHTSQSCSTYSRAKVGVVATSIAKETWPFVFGNFNVAEATGNDCGYEIVRPVDREAEPFVWEAARATAAAPFFFQPTDIPGIGSFQDGGLRDNLAADIARRLSRQIWPSKKNPARLLSMGTGVTARNGERSPHFRHVFRDSFLRRGFDAWMSSMDTETKWFEMMAQTPADTQEDYLRLNVPLQNMPSAIDTVEAMDEYRNLVTLYPGSARMAREVATALLVSRFFFVLDCLPGERCSPVWCRGLIRCKGPAKLIVDALDQLHPQGLEYRSDFGLIGRLDGASELCSTCGRYGRPIAFLTDHIDTVVNIYVTSKAKKQRWRLSGFPNSMASFAAAQHLHAPFGSSDNCRPGTVVCQNCDRAQILIRKRFSTQSRNDQAKKARLV
ncbi:patatin-like phospholipase family protein [Aspergillus melleus]|uniref:patatin-like phospholipase family protein n=1 Tax=Aspergillus melleus TaxID=138277 RepID=UPI001E8CCE00|nr:uncharacterized protein LDX57_009108 [Aspergillus melleus]KAH8431446.1 hypothetical protein LDX57_009108 [Aspergillus melleus]